jgi:type II secretory pathway pseudopilin PulG
MFMRNETSSNVYNASGGRAGTRGRFDAAHHGRFDAAHRGRFDAAHHGRFDAAHHGRFDGARHRRAGFTFIEVLFAVILLGIGFIMIAGIFPTAIQQTAVVSDETQGSLICRGALRRIQEVAETRGNLLSNGSALFPQTVYSAGSSSAVPRMCAFSPNLSNAIGADAFFTGDRQYAWVGFYSRNSATDPMAQVYVVALKNPNFVNYVTHFMPGEVSVLPGAGGSSPQTIPLPPVAPPIPPARFNYAQGGTAAPTAALAAMPINPAIPVFLVYDKPTGTATVRVRILGGKTYSNLTTGAYMIVGSDNITGTPISPVPTPYPTAMVGRILRLGAEVTNLTTLSGYQAFQLQAGYDFNGQDIANLATVGSGGFVWAFVMGRAPEMVSVGTAPNVYSEPAGDFLGANQDIAVMSGWVHVNTSAN